MEMTENHDVDVGGDGDNDKNSMLDVEMAGYRNDDARDSLYKRQILDIPRKPVQKSISSHFRENISPTSPTRVTYPEIEMVSPESQRSRQRRAGSPTSQYSPGHDLVSPETIRDRPQTPEPIREVEEAPEVQEIPIILDGLRVPERPISFVSSIEAMSFEGPSTRFDMPRAAPTPPMGGDDYHVHQHTGSQDYLLKMPPPGRNGTGNWFIRRSIDWWFMELLSFLVSLLSIIAIIIILRVYDNKPSSEWPQSISLNSLLAIFITLAQAGLILPVSEAISQLKWVWFKEDERPLIDFETFDQASRSPLGGIKLLQTLRFQYVGCVRRWGGC